MRKHTGEKTYQCKQCNKTFSEKNHIYWHMITDTGNKQYHCIKCNKAFINKTTFNAI